jgi:alpha-galactosidase
MLEVGNGLTESEDRAHFALWAMLAAPLMAGNDLRQMSDDVRGILTANEIVAIDQDARGLQARRIRREADAEVWVRGLAGTRAFAVALLNCGSQDRELRAGFDEIGFAATDVVRVRDLWLRSDIGARRREIVTTVPSHSAAVLRVTAY